MGEGLQSLKEKEQETHGGLSDWDAGRTPGTGKGVGRRVSDDTVLRRPQPAAEELWSQLLSRGVLCSIGMSQHPTVIDGKEVWPQHKHGGQAEGSSHYATAEKF